MLKVGIEEVELGAAEGPRWNELLGLAVEVAGDMGCVVATGVRAAGELFVRLPSQPSSARAWQPSPPSSWAGIDTQGT